VEYGEGLLGGIGETRKSCIVHKISDMLVDEAHLCSYADEIKTALFFPNKDGKRVIEVGGTKRYDLLEGVSVRDIESILCGKSHGKDLKSCLREVSSPKSTTRRKFEKSVHV